MKYIAALLSCLWDVMKDEIACAIVDVQKLLKRLKRTPKVEEFEEEAFRK